MAEYIEREAATNAVVNYFWKTLEPFSAEGLAKAVNSVSTADVVERKRGRWIVRDCRIVCSRCDAVLAETANDDVTEETLRGSVLISSEKYCYNCGADMREGDHA